MVCYLAVYWAFYLMYLWLSLYKKDSVAFATERSVYPKDLVVYITLLLSNLFYGNVVLSVLMLLWKIRNVAVWWRADKNLLVFMLEYI